MAKRRKPRTRKRDIPGADILQPELPIGEPIQEATWQMPVNEHSLMMAKGAPEIARAVATYLYRFSNWDTGKSHRISVSRIANFLDVSKGYVQDGLRWLKKNEWLSVANKTAKGTVYDLIHHKCDPLAAPRDKDGLPKHLAISTGANSACEKMEAKLISWKAWLFSVYAQVHADWTTRIVQMTWSEFKAIFRFGAATFQKIKKELSDANLLRRISKRCEAFVAQLIPKPYPERRRRKRIVNSKHMKRDEEFYYSFNEQWRVSHIDGHIETMIEGTSTWRHSNEFELQNANIKIYNDFAILIEMVLSPGYQRYARSKEERLSTVQSAC